MKRPGFKQEQSEIQFEVLSTPEMARDWLEYQHERENNPEKYALKSTGIATLDEALGGGIELGQYVLIGGAQKSGKTTLEVSMFKAFCRQQVNSIWFGAEMSTRQTANMIFSNMTGIERGRIRSIGSQKLSVEDWHKLEAAAAELEQYTGQFTYGITTVADMLTVIDHVEQKTGKPVQAVFGDYLQLWSEPGMKDPVQELNRISRNLKQMTINRGHPMAVIFATQLNRESIKNKQINANSFLGGGGQERDMDLGMIIFDRVDEISGFVDPHKKALRVVGSRETKWGSGDLTLYYDGATASIGDKIYEVDLSSYWK